VFGLLVCSVVTERVEVLVLWFSATRPELAPTHPTMASERTGANRFRCIPVDLGAQLDRSDIGTT
jgi:hypothetical protein